MFFKNINIRTQCTRNKEKGAVGGFTILEILVVVAVTVMLSSLVLVNHGKFRTTISLASLTYDIALALREAQVYGTSVREANEIGIDQFRIRYGVHFDRSDDTTFFIFIDRGGADNEGDGAWDGGVQDIKVETFTLRGGNRLTALCVTVAGGTEDCVGFNDLDITFARPNPNSIIITDGVGSSFVTAEIKVTSVQGVTRSVVVHQSGQISVQ
jgi:type II secretory pathway pseudopilin PulG